MFAKRLKGSATAIALSALILALALTLCACGLMGAGGRSRVTEVSLETVSGLTPLEEGVYGAQVGEEFSLKLAFNEGAPSAPSVKWYISVDGREKTALESSSKTLKYTFGSISDSEYVFSAEANNVASSNSIKVKVIYAALSRVELSSSSDEIVQNIIQRQIGDRTPVQLAAAWNKGLAPDSAVTVFWYTNNLTTPSEEGPEFSFIPPSEKGVTQITVRVSDGKTSVEATVSIQVVTEYVPVDAVTLSAVSGAEGSDGQIKQLSSSTSFDPVTLQVGVTPSIGTNLASPVVWTVRNKNGTRVLAETGRTLGYTPVYGENYVTASVDNKQSLHIVIIALTEAEYAANKKTLETTYIWRGGIYNHYITDQTDLEIFVNHIIAEKKVGVEYPMYLYPTEWKSGSGYSSAFYSKTNSDGALNRAIGACDEAGLFNIDFDATRLILNAESSLGVPKGAYNTAYTVDQISNVPVHYGNLATPRDSLPIDDVSKTMTVSDSNMLYRAVSWGYRPLFGSDPSGVKVSALYDKARAVLLSIIDEGMSEYEKVRAIYEWIIMNVDYDYGAAESNAEFKEVIGYNAFYLEGVFDDYRAVCDGKSKAFALMCGMEGIECARIDGTAVTPVSVEPVGHAWNKVLVDPDGDGVRQWYVVDTTWGDSPMQTGSQFKYNEMMSMEYFLIDDDYILSTHLPSSSFDPPAVTEFDYYGATTVSYGGVEISLLATSKDAIKQLGAYAKAEGIRLNIRVDCYGIDDAGDILRTLGTGFSVLTLDAASGNYIIS